MPATRSVSNRRARPMPAPDADRIAPPTAAELTCLGYPEQFNQVRWQLEEAFDPTTLEVIAIPPTLQVPLLTTAQLRRLPDSERTAYLERKAERIAWTRARWMRVPAWGGRAAPGGEYRYSAARCRTWHERSLGAQEG